MWATPSVNPGCRVTNTATRTETRPYIESRIESLRQAGDRPVLRWDGADTTGSHLLAAIYRYARALESLGTARGDSVAMYAPARPSTPPGASTRSPARSARRWHQQWWSAVDWIPLTEQGKPDRPEIRELAAATGR